MLWATIVHSFSAHSPRAPYTVRAPGLWFFFWFRYYINSFFTSFFIYFLAHLLPYFSISSRIGPFRFQTGDGIWRPLVVSCSRKTLTQSTNQDSVRHLLVCDGSSRVLKVTDGTQFCCGRRRTLLVPLYVRTYNKRLHSGLAIVTQHVAWSRHCSTESETERLEARVRSVVCVDGTCHPLMYIDRSCMMRRLDEQLCAWMRQMWWEVMHGNSALLSP